MNGGKIPLCGFHQVVVELVPVSMGFAAGQALQGLFHFVGEIGIPLAQGDADLVEIQVFQALFVYQGGAFAGDKFRAGAMGQGGQQVILAHSGKTSFYFQLFGSSFRSQGVQAMNSFRKATRSAAWAARIFSPFSAVARVLLPLMPWGVHIRLGK